MQRQFDRNDIIEYEHSSAGKLPACDRPVFHLTPPIGWMNDPNGFSWYEGRYHLFYQYYPFDTCWGPVSWGHAVSRDLLRWEQLPPALVPDQDYDCGGCFSGTAVQLDDGRQMLMYTGYVPVPGDPEHRGVQSQCIAFGDGLGYEKYEGNPVITDRDLPQGGDRYEFRDPKLKREKDGSFRVLVANHNRSRGAQILQYASGDGLHWSFDRVLAQNRTPGGAEKDRLGWMWECPDDFRLNDRRILIASAMDVDAEDAGAAGISAYPDRKTCFCMIGEETADGGFREIAHHPLDQGFDFYAGQSMQAPDGRRILIGWMQDPDTAEHRGIDFPVNGQMSLPRQLELKEDRLLQWPVAELDQRRADPVIHKGLRLEGELPEGIRLEGVSGRLVDMEVSIRPCEKEPCRKIGIRFAARGQGPGADSLYTELTFEPESAQVTLDRSHAGPGHTERTRRQIKVRQRGGKLDIRLVLDRLSAEVFINNGEQVMSAVIYTDRTAEDIIFFTDGVAMVDIAKYRIKEK